MGRRSCLAGAVVAVACLSGGGAIAQGKLDARYAVSLAGVQIGEGAWVIEIGDDQFTAAASGMTTGLLRVFATGQGSGASRGTVRGDNLMPTTFVSNITNDRRVEDLRIVLSSGTVKDLSVDPPTVPNPERIPLADAHRRGVTDPVSAGDAVAGNGDPVSPKLAGTLPVFDADALRPATELQGIEGVQAQKGYQGPVAVCGARSSQAGRSRAGSAGDQVSGAQRDGDKRLAPILGPHRCAVSHFAADLLGGALEATHHRGCDPADGPATAAAR
jgi:hypothetical protein